MNKTLLILIFLAPIVTGTIKAQAPSSAAAVVQPSIIVIPYTKEGENIRTILESDPNNEIAITTVEEAIRNRGFTDIYSFTQTLKNAEADGIFTSDNKNDAKSALTQYSKANIYITVQITKAINVAGSEVTVTLKAFETSTSQILASKNCNTGDRPWKGEISLSKLIQTAINRLDNPNEEETTEKPKFSNIELFLDVMQKAFDDVRINGKLIIMDISFDAASKFTMNTDIGTDGDVLKDVIKDWIAKNCFKNYYKRLKFVDLNAKYELKVPLLDSEYQNYDISEFSKAFRKFLKTLSITASTDENLNTIYVTIK